MTTLPTLPNATQVRAYFRDVLTRVAQPLAAIDEALVRDDGLVHEDREALAERLQILNQQVATALDLDQVAPAVRRELYGLVLQPDNPEAIDDLDDQILDRLLGYAVQGLDRDELTYYAQTMGAGRHSCHDRRLRELTDLLAATQPEPTST